jgi:diguanylate cyclase (GGDEF)-like protein/PAS domain S-box-containing protein
MEVATIDATELPIDNAARDAMLESLLHQHPGALVTAMDGYGRVVDLPPSIVLAGQRVLATRSAIDLFEADSRAAMLDNWERAKLVGSAVAPVVLVNGVEASCHVVDVRHSHGVFVGMIVADVQIELFAGLTDRPPVMPKTGRMDKDEVAMIRFADDRICQILHYDVDDLVGTRSLDLIHPEDQARAIDAWMEMLTSPGGTTRLRARHRRKDGSWLWMELTNNNLLEQAEGSVVTEMIDISDEMAALESLRQREQLLARLAEALPSGVLHVDRDRNVVYANARLHSVVGVGPSATVEEQLAAVIADDRYPLAAALQRVLLGGRDDDLEVRLGIPGTSKVQRCAVAIRGLTDADGAPAGAVLCIDDVTEASALRAELERRATVDELTGCLNRAAVLDELDRTLRRDSAGSSGTAVVFLDLDGFKEVNDTFGHKAGDQLLAGAAARLRSGMRGADVIGRLGGDEFIIVLPSIDSLAEAMRIGLRLADALTAPLEIVGGVPMRIRSSIGVAWASAAGVTADALTAAADRAMYESKRAGSSEPVYVTV